MDRNDTDGQHPPGASPAESPETTTREVGATSENNPHSNDSHVGETELAQILSEPDSSSLLQTEDISSNSPPAPPPTSRPSVPDAPWQYLEDIMNNTRMPGSEWIDSYTTNTKIESICKLQCYEVSQNGVALRLNFQLEGDDLYEHWYTIRDSWQWTPGIGRLRMIVVQDLSEPLVEVLGSALELDPLIFIRHLQESGEDAKFQTKSWISEPVTSYLDRNIISLRWHRPVFTEIDRPKKPKKKNDGWSEPAKADVDNSSDDEPDESAEELEIEHWQPRSQRSRGYSRITGIYRDEWITGMKPVSVRKRHSLVPSSWLEKATIYSERINGTDFILILTDPLPELRSTKNAVEVLANATIGSRSSFRSVSNDVILRYRPMSTRWTARSLRWTRRSTQVQYPQGIRTTADDMVSWLTNQCDPMFTPEHSPPVYQHPLQSLFMVAFLDSMMFADSLSKCLDDIQKASSKEGLLRKFMNSWVETLSQAQAELPALRDSLQNYVRQALLPEQAFTEMQLLTVQATQKLNDLLIKTDRVYDFVRAEYTALDSRKQLSESESVNRLTELAFIFIPISFVASTFSMQIQELQSPPALSAFVYTSVIVLFLAYTVRLSIRSTFFLKASQTVAQKVRSQESIRDDQPVPTRAVLSAFLAFLQYVVVSMYTVSLVHLAAIAWLWASRRDLDTAFKTALTTLLIMCLSGSLSNTQTARRQLIAVAEKGWLNFAVPPRLRMKVKPLSPRLSQDEVFR